MIPEYINNWFHVIETMQNENTYKLAWGRALVECIYHDIYSVEDNKIKISLNDIAFCMLKYYWNQIFFFNLRQSPKRVDKRQPVIVQATNELIDKYKQTVGNNSPVWFDKVGLTIKKKDIEKTIIKIVSVLPNDVSWRFKRVENDEIPLYEYDAFHRSKTVIFNKKSVELIKEYAIVISKLLNYKWAQLLEKFNYSPKIVGKVNSISESKVKRESLVKYKKELMKEFENGKAIDFYSGEPLEDNDISVDHVIPWSFMYSDDIWNLVLTSKSHNSSKSNSIPSQQDIDRLKARNKLILGKLDDKYNLELEESINNDYVDKYYFECRM